MAVRLIQFTGSDGSVNVASVLDDARVQTLNGVSSVYDLAWQAISHGYGLSAAASRHATGPVLDYAELVEQGRLLPPVTHADPAHLTISGTGLTHLGSAGARDAMHAKLNARSGELSDSMKMFRMGLEGGRPSSGKPGVQPEWFYKGDGSVLVAPEQALIAPSFALDGGEEPEICGLYLVGPGGMPYRLGFALGNEFSDHKMERINYLYLAHSKLRNCAVGPELRVGPLPDDIAGTSRIRRAGEIVWEKPFVSGEANMSHSIANLEAHHFKYRQFLRPGDVHMHFFGTATLSFADGFEAREGDVFEIQAEGFGRPLRNALARGHDELQTIVTLD
jgi:hypothetical protein